MAKTIDDYKKEYAAAKAAGDAAGMQAANDGANAIRSANGEAAQYAVTDISNTAAKSAGYTTQNQKLYPTGDGYDKTVLYKQLLDQVSYAQTNPTATKAYTPNELYAKYGSVMDANPTSGMYTKNLSEAQAAADAYGVNYTPTSYNGEDGWYLVDKAQHTAQTGTSGADEDLLTDQEYAIVQQLKQQYAQAQTGYKNAVAAGAAELAAQYKAAMDEAHLEAERVRAGARLGGYSGGADGSQYLTYGALANPEIYNPAGPGAGNTELENLYAAAVEGRGSGSGGSSSYGYSSGGSDLSSYIEQMYAAKQDAAIADIEAAYQKNLASLDKAETGIEEQYQAARNQSAGQSEQLKRNFAQYAAANGLNNGTAGQAELARSVTLQNDLNGITTAEASAHSELEMARANAEIEYNNAIAQAQAEGNYEQAYALYQEKVRVQELLAQEQEALMAQSSAQQSQLAAYGESYLQAGIMPSDEMLAAMGITQADAQSYINALGASAAAGNSKTMAEYGWKYLNQGAMPNDAMLAAMGLTQADAQVYLMAQQAAKAAGGTSSGGSSGSSGGSGITMTLTTAKQAASNGVFNDQVLEVLRENGYTDDMLEAIYGYVPNVSGQGTGGSAGMSDAYFTATMRTISGALASGKADSAQNAIDQIWNQLSESQRANLNRLIASYGGAMQ